MGVTVLITSVEPIAGGLVRITLDAEQATLLAEDVLLAGLRSGAEVARDRWQELRRDGERRVALRAAMIALSRRAFTEAELRQRLLRAHSDDATAAALQRLREIGYLDDKRWAEGYIAQPRSQLRGRALLRQELRSHGVDRMHSETVLADHDDRAAAFEAATRRVRSMRDLDPMTRQRRLMAFLQRRGFSAGLAYEACRAAEPTIRDVGPHHPHEEDRRG